jgi:membrane protease YdiL (CAAX protease family)
LIWTTIFAVLLAVLPLVAPNLVVAVIELLLAGVVGWRSAYVAFVWDADAHVGVHTPPETYRRARHAYWTWLPIFLVASLVLGAEALIWRGVLPTP